MTADSRVCRHCHVPVIEFPTDRWWHRGDRTDYRACRDEAGRLIGSTLAEPAEVVA